MRYLRKYLPLINTEQPSETSHRRHSVFNTIAYDSELSPRIYWPKDSRNLQIHYLTTIFHIASIHHCHDIIYQETKYLSNIVLYIKLTRSKFKNIYTFRAYPSSSAQSLPFLAFFFFLKILFNQETISIEQHLKISTSSKYENTIIRYITKYLISKMLAALFKGSKLFEDKKKKSTNSWNS